MMGARARWPDDLADQSGPSSRTIELTALLKQRARELGFDHVGVAGVEPFIEGRIVVQRIERGLLAGMDWFTVERARFASDVRNLLPGARSVVAVASSYYVDDDQPSDDRSRGEIARYARGVDYHPVMKRRLRELESYLVELVPAADAACCVDTGRVIDRAIARRAGIGWYGKNSCLLTHGSGSWVLLGSMITTVELVPDQPLRTTCGACTRCVDACPTGAIIEPGVLDARRCISYLTIENRGPIPRALRPLIGTWIFGCDICQDVCPVNRRASPAAFPELRERRVDPFPELVPLLRVSEEDFREKFAGTAVKRVKRDGFVRNVAVALGNLHDTRALPALVAALGDDSPLVRSHVAWAIGQTGGEGAPTALRAARDRESDPTVRDEIEQALAVLAGD